MQVKPKLVDIALKVRRYRELIGLSREQFAEMTEQNTEYWGSIERGERAISLERVMKVCKTFGVSPMEFLPTDLEDEDTEWDQARITEKLKTLSKKQLIILEKFIDDIVANI